MTTSKAGTRPDRDQTDVTSRGLCFLSNVSGFFRKRYKSVHDLNDAEFLSLFDIPSVNHRIDNRFNIKSTAALVQHFHARTKEDAASGLAE